MRLFQTPILLCFFATTLSVQAQVFNPYYHGIVQNVTQSNILDDLYDFEAFGIKQPGTTAIENTKTWIVNRYQDLGYTDIEIQPFTVYGQPTSNIIVTKTGSVYPNTFLIIDAHYDTVNGPGTNDNGSGTVLLLELARLLKDVNTEYSIKFIHFSGEEEGLIGSQYYVTNTVIPENMDIKLVLNIDQVGGVAGRNNNTIVCERDLNSLPSSNNAASEIATQEMAICFALYSNLQTEISYAYGSDYMPFENNGEVITGLYEKNESIYPHTPYDTIDNMDPDYVYEVAKGAIGAALHFAEAKAPLGISEEFSAKTIAIYPNPSGGNITINLNSFSKDHVELSIYNVLGKTVYHTSLSGKSNLLNLSFLASGIYTAVFKDGQQKTIKKLVLY